MKIEGGGGGVSSGATATALSQKIKVKEEAQEQQAIMAPKATASTSPNLAVASATEESHAPVANNSESSPVDLDIKSRLNKGKFVELKHVIQSIIMNVFFFFYF